MSHGGLPSTASNPRRPRGCPARIEEHFWKRELPVKHAVSWRRPRRASRQRRAATVAAGSVVAADRGARSTRDERPAMAVGPSATAAPRTMHPPRAVQPRDRAARRLELRRASRSFAFTASSESDGCSRQSQPRRQHLRRDLVLEQRSSNNGKTAAACRDRAVRTAATDQRAMHRPGCCRTRGDDRETSADDRRRAS